ncbi:hypothetical protein SVIOM342S_07655 [Streptomyces violaceorubidus]
MLGGKRAPLIQSFGTQPQVVVEHALAAHRIRRDRDNWLTAVMVLCGLLFLPGLLVWLLVFQIRTTIARREDKRAGALATALLVALAVLAVLFLLRCRSPASGPGTRARPSSPRWSAGSGPSGSASARPGTSGRDGTASSPAPAWTPRSPRRCRAAPARRPPRSCGSRWPGSAPNSSPTPAFTPGPRGSSEWAPARGSWQLAEELVPVDPDREIHPFRSWDVIKAVHDRLRMLERGPLQHGRLHQLMVRHWIVTPIGENADAVSRPEGTDVEAYQVKQHAVQEICDKQQFGAGDRHYLGVQWTLWHGELVITMLITVTVLHETLRIEVTGHALGPVYSLFTSKPAAKEKAVQKSVKFWETRDGQAPAGRLATRWSGWPRGRRSPGTRCCCTGWAAS